MLCRIYLDSCLSVAALRTGGTTLEVRVSDRKRSSLLKRIAVPAALLAAAASAAMAALPSAALASPTTPPSAISVQRHDPAGPRRSCGGQPEPVRLPFSCATALGGGDQSVRLQLVDSPGDIWSYTIVVTRRNDDNNNVTYEAPTANVLTPAGAVDTTQYVNCSSFVPSDGFGCYRSRPGRYHCLGPGQRHKPALSAVHPGR